VSLKIELAATDLVQRDGRQLALLRVHNSAGPRTVVVDYRLGPHSESRRARIPHGQSDNWLGFPVVDTVQWLRVALDSRVLRTRVPPPRNWTIHLVNHTHTDVGYVDYQPNVNRSFFQFMLEAMALVEQTKSFPEPARFRWTIETAYHLRNFQRFASRQQFRALIGHLRRRTIEATAGFLQMTDLPSTDQVIRSFRFIHDFARRHRIPVHSSMACDINGLPWIYPAALHDLGARNLSMALNADMARRPLEPPMPFWWESPEGKRVLVWHGDIYLLGNRFGIERGVDDCTGGVAGYLSDLAKRGYTYDHVVLLMSGAKLDCAPPTVGPSLTVRDWNARFVNPTMRLDTLSPWFRQLRQVLPDGVAVHRGHWPDYWAHGLGSAADEVRYARETQHLLSAAGTASSYVRATDRSWQPPAAEIERAYDAAELAGEHTWGAASSVAAPHSNFAKIQRQYKRDHFYRARLESESALHTALERIGRTTLLNSACVVVHNPLAWARSGVAELNGIQWPLPGYCVENLADAETGRAVPYWRAQQQGTFLELGIQLRNVPATGYRVLRVTRNREPKVLEWVPVKGAQSVVENRYYRVRAEARTGRIREIYDKQLRRNLVRSDRELPFGRIIQEQLPGPEARHWANRSDRRKRFSQRAFRRSAATARAFRRTELPGCFQQITFDGTCRGLAGVTTTIRLYEREKRIDFIWCLSLHEHPDPQAAYVAFPFSGGKPRTWLEVPGAAMEPGVDQIPTTCYDFYTVQNFVRVEAGRAAITLVPRDTPLVQLNEISTFQFREKLPRFNGTIVGWLLNNYWHTNFPASQPGGHTFRFSLTSGRLRSHDTAASYRFAYEVANPLRATFLPETPLQAGGRSSRRRSQASFVQVEPRNVMLLSVSRADDDNACLFRLQETTGRRTRAVLRFDELMPRRALITDLYGGNARLVTTRGRSVQPVLPPRALATVTVEF